MLGPSKRVDEQRCYVNKQNILDSMLLDYRKHEQLLMTKFNRIMHASYQWHNRGLEVASSGYLPQWRTRLRGHRDVFSSAKMHKWYTPIRKSSLLYFMTINYDCYSVLHMHHTADKRHRQYTTGGPTSRHKYNAIYKIIILSCSLTPMQILHYISRMLGH